MNELETDQLTQAVSKLAEIKAKMAQIQRRALPGKCPIRFCEGVGEEIEWETPIMRDPYKTWDEAVKHLTATTDYQLAGEIFTRGVNAMPGKDAGRSANIAVQTLADSEPQDATDARLSMQEMALYAQGMRFLSRAGSADMVTQGDYYMRSAIKLLRLHNETVEARSKHRRGGEQRVIVQHVNVSDGGQAVVNGSYCSPEGGGERRKTGEALHG